MHEFVQMPDGGFVFLFVGLFIWYLSKSSNPSLENPSSVKGWFKLCRKSLNQFELLEDESEFLIKSKDREKALDEIIQRSNTQNISVISTKFVDLPNVQIFQRAFKGANSFNLSIAPSLSLNDENWNFPSLFLEQEALIYYLPLPLRAVDLLWLEKVPQDQPSWIITKPEENDDWIMQLKMLNSQLPERWTNRILKFDGTEDQIIKTLTPIKRFLDQPHKNIDLTNQRLLSKLYQSLQTDLEKLRRNKFRTIQNRSQWIVAGAVFASPVPSTDLLSVAVVNGLMIQEMGKLWDCNISPKLLKEVANKLAIAALGQGVAEWSGQALLGAAKLHGGSWLAAGTMQALSAAYLTRVVGRSMADWMALNKGVSQPDLELLKTQAPGLIANAANEEKVDWSLFLNQANSWVNQFVKNQILKSNPAF